MQRLWRFGPAAPTDVMQFPLDYPECCIYGSIRRGATPGHMEALPDEQELNAYSLMPSLLHKGDTRLTDVVIGRVEVLSRSAIHPIRCGASVMCLASMSKRIGIPSPRAMVAVTVSGEEQGHHGAAKPQLGIPLAYLPRNERPMRKARFIPKLEPDMYNHAAAVWQYTGR